MAKNFNNGVMGYVKASFKWALLQLAALVVAILGTVWCVGMLITSPLWFPVMVFINPERAAQGFYNKESRSFDVKPAWMDWWTVNIKNILIYYLMRWLWTPLVALLPMKYRAEFIRCSDKHVSDYSVRTQLAYYRSFDAEGKKALLHSGGVFSMEAKEAIWSDPNEWGNWIDAGLELNCSQIKTLCRAKAECSSLLWRYFKAHTPSKEQLAVLINGVYSGYIAPEEVLIKLIRQQRPNADMLSKLFATDREKFIEKVNAVVDEYADLDAVNFDISGMDDEQKKQLLAERWSNFCKSKKQISCSAQKKMSHWQYTVFVATGHKLNYFAMQYLCLYLGEGERSYLKEVISNEFEQVDSKLLTALKSEYWRYSVYLEVEEERRNSAA